MAAVGFNASNSTEKGASCSGMSPLCPQHVPDFRRLTVECPASDLQWSARRVEPIHTGPLGWEQHKEWTDCLEGVRVCLGDAWPTSDPDSSALHQILAGLWGEDKRCVPTAEEIRVLSAQGRLLGVAREEWGQLTGAPEPVALIAALKQWQQSSQRALVNEWNAECNARSTEALTLALLKVWGEEAYPPVVRGIDRKDMYRIAEEEWLTLPGAPTREVLQAVLQQWEASPSAPSEERLLCRVNQWKALIAADGVRKALALDALILKYQERSAAINRLV